jgi:sarcosine oxidase
MGSATVYELARRKKKVLGLEQFTIAHNRGSSHGLSRIIRLAYWESPAYVPLLRRAYVLWGKLEDRCRETLFYKTGSIDAGLPNSDVVLGSQKSCAEHDLKCTPFDAVALRRRYPGYRLEDKMIGIFQSDGGFLLPERCVSNYVIAAQEEGVTIHTGETVTGWEPSPSGVTVNTDVGCYKAQTLVITAGPWTRQLLPEMQDFAIPERQAVLWTRPLIPDHFHVGNFPVFNLEAPGDRSKYYGFPIHGWPSGFKIGKYHHRKEQGNLEELHTQVDDEDERVVREGIRRFFPDADGARLALETCLFTNTPDEHFILDTLPQARHVAVAAGFSGHGFKFCSVVGEIMADLVTAGSTSHNIGQFSLSRFLRSPLKK